MGVVLRWARRLVVTVVVLLAVVVVGGGAYYASQLLPAQPPFPETRDVEVVTLDGDMALLDATDADETDTADLATDGIFGFSHDTGYTRLVGPAETTEDGVRRRVEVLTGEPPTVGTRGDVQVSAFPEIPETVTASVVETSVEGPLGTYPAWEFAGTGDTWVVFVHGRGATRAESLRGVQIATSLGLPAFVTTYRNDGFAPPSEDGYGHFGGTEWQDLDAAVEHLRDRGARRFVLFGHSQGGSVVASWYRNADFTEDVAGLVLDSPLLSIQRTLVLQAQQRDIPDPLIAPMLTVTKAIAHVVGDVDFAALEHVEAADELDVPMLVLHGRDDVDVPFGPSEDLAEARPDTVELVAFDGRHVRGWNTVNDTYVTAVVDFLAAVT